MPKSKCCKAKVKIVMAKDFFGDVPKQLIGTCYYICCKCNNPCDIFFPVRKKFKINPKTRVQPNKKRKKLTKQNTKKLIELIRNS